MRNRAITTDREVPMTGNIPEEVSQSIKDRLSHPISGTALFLFFVVHWDTLMYAYLSSGEPEERIKLIISYFHTHTHPIPFLLALVFYLFLMPFIYNIYYQIFVVDRDVKRSQYRKSKEKVAVATTKEFREQNNRLENLRNQFNESFNQLDSMKRQYGLNFEVVDDSSIQGNFPVSKRDLNSYAKKIYQNLISLQNNLGKTSEKPSKWYIRLYKYWWGKILNC